MAHIAIACAACGSDGSVADVAIKHSRELAKYYERVTLVSNSFPQMMPENVERGLVVPLKFNFLRRFCHVPNELAFTCSVRNYLEGLHKRNPIDMIICHSHALAALSAKPLKDRNGIPFGLVTHGDIFDRPKGTYDNRLTVFYKGVTPYAYRNADLIIALSPYMAECAIKGGANPKVVNVIPNGIDSADIGLQDKVNISHPREKQKTDPIRLLFVGRLSVEKGIDVLIKACDRLNNKNVKFTLKIIGDGPMKDQIHNFVENSNISNLVQFFGRIQRDCLGDYYRNADILCVPSISEAQGLAVLEALVSGTPVIGSEIGGIPFMIRTGQNGLLVPPKNSEALADAIESLYRKPEKLSLLKKNARSLVFPRFSWENIGKTIYDLLEERKATHP
jgi:glycosyltransferase involved in cell wall biosynthesis